MSDPTGRESHSRADDVSSPGVNTASPVNADDLALVIDQAHEGLCVLDAQGCFLFANRCMAEMLGQTPAALLGKSAEDFIHPDDDPSQPGKDSCLTLKHGTVIRLTLARADGSRFEAEFSTSRLPDGRAIGFVRDVAELLAAQRDLRESEQRHVHNEKLEVIGRLAGGVAHDFNNMLTAILGETELLLMQMPTGSPLREQAINIRDAAMRSATLTRQLLAFARRPAGQARALDLGAAVMGMEPLLRQFARAGVRLSLEPPVDSPWVVSSLEQIEQAVMNLVTNARDAIAEGGTISIRIGHGEITAEDMARRGARQTGPHAWFEVADDGVGIAPDMLSKVFEPFFTTKPRGQGSGLGLMTVQGLVDQGGGFVEVESTVGKGTTVRVLLPQVPAPSAEVDAIAAGANGGSTVHGAASPASATILLVDDELPVRTFVVSVLRRLGYRILVAANPQEALTHARVHEGPIDLLLTDVVMPGTIDGIELARRAQHRWCIPYRTCRRTPWRSSRPTASASLPPHCMQTLFPHYPPPPRSLPSHRSRSRCTSTAPRRPHPRRPRHCPSRSRWRRCSPRHRRPTRSRR